jgi:pimeloyl-ACP methyl ester carboxylesterase
MAPSISQTHPQPTHYRTATVRSRKVFYREAGDPGSPTIVLLHGLPTSSQMFRELIPALADQFHLIAPDYIGFGHSDTPSNKDFEYTFENLAAHVRGLLDQLNLASYILYMQDYGGPIGFRLFTGKPEQVKGFIIQNANAYMEGVGDVAKSLLARETLPPSTRTTGSSIRLYSTGLGCRTIRSICWRTTNPMLRCIPSGRPLSVRTGPEH